jgi:hypothetical protein
MIRRTSILFAALLCLPSLSSAQAPAGPLAAPALPQLAAPVLAPGSHATDAALLPLSMEAQEPLQKSNLLRSVPLSTVMGVGGGLVGFLSGLVLLDCQDGPPECGVGPDDSEIGLLALGLALGASTGAHYGGRRANSKGNRWLTLAAAAAGTLPIIIGDVGSNNELTLIGAGLSISAAVATDHFVRRPR